MKQNQDPEAIARQLKALTRVSESTGCWDWTAGKAGPLGYASLYLNGKMRRANRVSYEVHRGPIPIGMQVLHTCDNPACINPKHLFLGTHVDNMNDKIAKGRQHRKLDACDVLAIRASKHVKQADLAKQYGISQPQISAIILGRKWKHLPL